MFSFKLLENEAVKSRLAFWLVPSAAPGSIGEASLTHLFHPLFCSLSTLHLLVWFLQLGSFNPSHLPFCSLLSFTSDLFSYLLSLTLSSSPLLLSPMPHQQQLLEWLSGEIMLVLQINSARLFVFFLMYSAWRGRRGSGSSEILSWP